MRSLVMDIEANELLVEVTRMWILFIKDIRTGEKKYYLEGDLSWKEELNNCDEIIGHNICGYDLRVLEKLFDYKLPKHVKVRDTLILSIVLNYNRFENNRHGLETWGFYLGMPKGDWTDFSQYHPDMLVYCEQDVDITDKVYEVLVDELIRVIKKYPALGHYIRAEQAASTWNARASLAGWPFDVEQGNKLFAKLENELRIARETITPMLGLKAVPKDKKGGEVIAKAPKWTKEGKYHAHVADWFGVDPWSGFEDRPIEGEYCRVTFEKLSLDSSDDVKMFLFRHGWEPTEWNLKRMPDGSYIKMSPKITDDSLELLQGHGKLYTDFKTASSRYSILKTWLENVDENGNLHGECFTIGTPSMRSRHSIIVNVPSSDSPYGKEMRSLFKCLAGEVLIGCDSSGNQARGLAHYLNSADYIDLLLNGDVHQYNADILTNVLKTRLNIEFTVTRAMAKRILYAFLFGASGKKLWSYIFGVMDAARGNKLKEGFTSAVPGFKNLLDTLKKVYNATRKFGDGYILSIVGTRIYVDSPHKLLVYLLQAMEKITCASALMYTMEKLEAENIPYTPCIFYHDEIDYRTPEEYAERAREIGKEAFKEAPKLYGVTIMDGEGKIGKNWYDVH